MGSTRQQDRSLGGGISLPQWMKGRMDNRFDFDESTFSPPSHDDSFFYIRYPKAQGPSSVPQGYRPIGHVLIGSGIGPSTNKVTANGPAVPDLKKVKEVDFSKHPLPCQPYVPDGANKGNEANGPRTVLAGSLKAKSQGTDDGFHGEPALCGKSIVHIANQIMSSKFTKMAASEQPGEVSPPRKGSKSLPVTPLASPMVSPDSSPKARRRMHPNRYFTGAFLPDREKYQGGWILGSILGQSREIVTAKIEEEDEAQGMDVQPPRTLSRKKSISSQNLTYIGKEEKAAGRSAGYTSAFQAKPSELREMNFWSPTSM